MVVLLERLHSNYNIIQFFATLYRYEQETVAFTPELLNIAKVLEVYDIGPLPTNTDANFFVHNVIDVFLEHFYLPNVQKASYPDLLAKTDKNGELHVEFMKTSIALENLISYNRNLTRFERSGTKMSISDFWYSGEMSIAVAAIRKWLNLLLRLHYVLTYFHLDQKLNKKTIKESINVYGNELLPYIILWADHVFTKYIPCKPKHNSRVAMDTPEDFLFNVCLSDDIGRMHLHQGRYKAWNPFKTHVSIDSFYTHLKDRTKVIPMEGKVDYKEVAYRLIEKMIDEKDWKTLVHCMDDIYALGMNRVGHLFVVAMAQKFAKIGNEKVEEYSRKNLAISSLSKQDLKNLQEKQPQSAPSDRASTKCTEITMDGFNIFSDPDIHDYKKFILNVKDFSDFDIITQFNDAISLSNAECNGFSSKTALTISKRLAGICTDQQSIYKLVEELFDNESELWKGTPLEPNLQLYVFLLDVCRYCATVGGRIVRGYVVGFLRFLMEQIKIMGGKLEEKTDRAQILEAIEMKYEINSREYKKNTTRDLICLIIDTINFISLIGPVSGAFVMSNCVEAYNNLQDRSTYPIMQLNSRTIKL